MGGGIERIPAGMDRRHLQVPILFFAEGRRSRDGALHPLEEGAALRVRARQRVRDRGVDPGGID